MIASNNRIAIAVDNKDWTSHISNIADQGCLIIGGWKAVSAFIIICSAHVHWFVLQLKLISIQSIIVLMMR
jgi:hypothetical protein